MDETEVLNHWKYFLSLEKDLVNLKNFVEIHQDNYATYSFELSKVLQLSCSEIDSICRLLCKVIDPQNDFPNEDTRSGNIAEYKRIILEKYPKFTQSEILIPDLGEKILPWDEWSSKNSPSWWEEYNKVKHYRHSCFKYANLKNTLYSMSSLMVVILYLHRAVVSGSYGCPFGISTTYFESDYFGSVRTVSPSKNLPDFM